MLYQNSLKYGYLFYHFILHQLRGVPPLWLPDYPIFLLLSNGYYIQYNLAKAKKNS